MVRFLMWYCFMLVALAVIQFCTSFVSYTVPHLLLLALVPLPLCLLADFVIEMIGSGLGGFISGWSSRRATTRESLRADLHKATYSKREGRFQEALSTINAVLDKDPEFPDALLLKARILWEGFGRRHEARGCLKKVIELVPDGEVFTAGLKATTMR